MNFPKMEILPTAIAFLKPMTKFILDSLGILRRTLTSKKQKSLYQSSNQYTN
ncbi:MAG: hypothetical protein V7L21_00090 [Nostoc sp.]|uniref:hypothetical protein n=1 Tax=Nostoc sp. TaxID=1180 RepID=UPI002FF874D3